MADVRCTEAWHKRVSAYHDGGIVPEERVLVAAHLHSCTDCQQVLRDYEQLYRGLRATPGFEGVVTITKPGDRRGMGATMRPMHTWPNMGPDSGRRPPLLGLVARVITTGLLLTLIALLVVVQGGHNGFSFSLGQSAASRGANATAAPRLPLANLTPNGTACANGGADASQAHAYLYARSGGEVVQVTGCANPVSLGTIAPSNFHLGSWSPDGQSLTVFTPDIPTTTTIVQLAIWDKTMHSTRQVPITTSVDNAVWANSTTLLVQSGGNVFQFNLLRGTVTQVQVKFVQNIVWRGGYLFYAASVNKTIMLYRYDTASGSSTPLTQLPVPSPGCPTVLNDCIDRAIWDVTADGNIVVYTQQHPAATTQIDLTAVRLSNLAPIVTKVLPTGIVPTALYLSPDGHAVAYQSTKSVNQLATVTVISLADTPQTTPVSVTPLDTVVWRPDSQALVVAPLHQSQVDVPQLLTIATGKVTPLVPVSSDYVWVP